MEMAEEEVFLVRGRAEEISAKREERRGEVSSGRGRGTCTGEERREVGEEEKRRGEDWQRRRGEVRNAKGQDYLG